MSDLEQEIVVRVDDAGATAAQRHYSAAASDISSSVLDEISFDTPK
jgi:hypothetical protein